jgi:hypothetical protein
MAQNKKGVLFPRNSVIIYLLTVHFTLKLLQRIKHSQHVSFSGSRHNSFALALCEVGQELSHSVETIALFNS